MSAQPYQGLVTPAPDPVERLRILAAGLPHVALVERVYDVPFERLWGFIGDLERSAPIMELGIEHVAILERAGDRLTIETRSTFGWKARFEVELRSGWCLMRNGMGDIGMAAAREGESGRTRFAHFEGTRWLGRLGRPLFARKILGDLDRIGDELRRP